MEAWGRVVMPVLPGRGAQIQIRDSATGELMPAATGPSARLYDCGITPYDATHIGHASTFTAWDLLVRALRDAGHEVTHVQNVTDVDDPLLERADRDGEDWRELAVRETDLYRRDMTWLRVLPPEHLIGAVEALPIIENLNERLLARGALYDLDEDVYFSRAADPSFGLLSGPGTVADLDTEHMAKLSAQRGGDPARPGKKDPLDPLVWRGERPGEPHWPSRFGSGRPGWHVECAAIASKYLGTSFDVQAGGADLIFPHHEMSGSHARVAYGAGAFARVYAHAGLVSYKGAKMSKSLGNLVFVNRLRESGIDPMAVRLTILAHHYRAEWEWTDAVLEQAQERLGTWRAAVAAGGADAGASVVGESSGASGSSGNVAAERVLSDVRERLADDLDAPGALAVVDRWAATGQTSGGALVRDTVDALLGVEL